MRRITYTCFLLVALACTAPNQKEKRLNVLEAYLQSLHEHNDDSWNYTTDTLLVWFDSKSSKPVFKIKGHKPRGMWAAWDEEMHSTSYYDTLWYDTTEQVVKGYFYENNDFYALIGKAPTKTLRTFWFTTDDKINEVLIYWISEANSTTSEHLKPIVSWAETHDSTTLSLIYENGRIIPSKENAIKWKQLIQSYNQSK